MVMKPIDRASEISAGADRPARCPEQARREAGPARGSRPGPGDLAGGEARRRRRRRHGSRCGRRSCRRRRGSGGRSPPYGRLLLADLEERRGDVLALEQVEELRGVVPRPVVERERDDVLRARTVGDVRRAARDAADEPRDVEPGERGAGRETPARRRRGATSRSPRPIREETTCQRRSAAARAGSRPVRRPPSGRTRSSGRTEPARRPRGRIRAPRPEPRCSSVRPRRERATHSSPTVRPLFSLSRSRQTLRWFAARRLGAKRSSNRTRQTSCRPFCVSDAACDAQRGGGDAWAASGGPGRDTHDGHQRQSGSEHGEALPPAPQHVPSGPRT